MELSNQSRTALINENLRTTWSYIRHELLYLMWALMEVALIAPVSLAFMPWATAWSPGLYTIWLLLLLLIPFNLVRLLTLLNVPLDRQRWLMLGAVFLVILLAVRALVYDPASIFDMSWLGQLGHNLTAEGNTLWHRDVVLFIIVAFTWWRGTKFISREPDIKQLGFRFRANVLFGLPILILAGHYNLGWSVAPYVLLYFAASFTAVSLTRAEQVEHEQEAPLTSMTPRWLAIVISSSLFVTLIAGLLAWTVNGVTAVQMGWLNVIWLPLRYIIFTAVATIFYLLTPLLNILEVIMQWLVSWMQGVFRLALSQTDQIQNTDFGAPPDQTAIERLLQPEPESIVNWRLVLIVMLIVLVVLIIFFMGRVVQRRRLAAGSDRHGQSTSKGQKPGSLGPGFTERLLNRLGLLRNWRTAVTIRRIYQHMCAVAAHEGYQRADTETPYEYLPTLSRLWPDNQEDARLITDAYIKIRYGEYPETDAEVDQIRLAWDQLEQAQRISTVND